MQVTKFYEGGVTLEENTVSREYSYGKTGKISVYPSKVDTVNNIIADFLRSECGVDAYYRTGPDSEYDFLWIYNVPFLFGIVGSNLNVTVYPPLGQAGVSSSTVGTTSSSLVTNLFYSDGVRYSFGLNFCGNPNTAFALRFKFGTNTTVNTNLVLRFMKGENIINRADGVMWCFTNVYAIGKTAADGSETALGGFNGIDMNGTSIDKDSFSISTMIYDPRLHTKAIHLTHNENWEGIKTTVSATASALGEITYGSNGRFVICNGRYVGGNSTKSQYIIYSEDGGLNWKSITSLKTSGYWDTGQYGTSEYVFVSAGNPSSINYSTNGTSTTSGGTWSAGASFYYLKSFFANGLFFILNGTSGYKNGYNIVEGTHEKQNITFPFTRSCCSVQFINGKFIAISFGGEIAFSDDGTTFKKQTTLFCTDINSNGEYETTSGDIVYASINDMILCGDILIAVTNVTPGKYFCSKDGINWLRDTMPNSSSVACGRLAYGNGVVVAGPYNSSKAAYAIL